MSEALEFNPTLAAVGGDKKAIKASHLEQTTVRQDDDVTLYREPVPDDKKQWFGHGGRNKNSGNLAYKYADLVASGNGALTAGDALEGDVIAAITDSDGRILYETTLGDAGTLSELAAEARSDRDVQPAHAPRATPGRYLEIIFNADAGADGAELDPTDSSARFWYSEVDR